MELKNTFLRKIYRLYCWGLVVHLVFYKNKEYLMEAFYYLDKDICPAEIYFDASSSSFKILDSNLINGRASGL